MADRLSAPLTEDVARKARRAKAHRAISTLPHFRSPHSDFVAREHASGRRAQGDRQGFEPEHHWRGGGSSSVGPPALSGASVSVSIPAGRKMAPVILAGRA